MLANWLVKYNGGFAWESNARLEFSWHPLLMVIGLVFLNGNGKGSFTLTLFKLSAGITVAPRIRILAKHNHN